MSRSTAMVPQNQNATDEWYDEHGNPIAPLHRGQSGQYLMPQGGMPQQVHHQGHVEHYGQQSHPIQQAPQAPQYPQYPQQQGSGQPIQVHNYYAPVNITNNVRIVHKIRIRNGRRVVETTTQTVNGAPPGTLLQSGAHEVQNGYGSSYNQPGQQQCYPVQKKASPLLIAAVIVLAVAALYFFSKSFV